MTDPHLRLQLDCARVRRKIAERTHRLQNLFWECTLRCNMRCRHCGSDCRVSTSEPDMPFGDFEKVLDIVRSHQDPTKTMVSTVGGEPLVRGDILECGRKITEKGYVWSMVSNGLLIDHAMADGLARAGLRSIAVDVDGTPADHNWLRRDPRGYDAVFNAIRCLLEQPSILFDVITCVNPRNLPHLPELKRLLIEAGVRKWRCFTIVPMGRAKHNDELILTDEDYRRLLRFIVDTRREGKIDLSHSCEGFLGSYEVQARSYIYNCHAGVSVASVRSNGDISGCLSVRSDYSQGNIYRDDFWHVWEHRFTAFRNREWMHTGQCADCSMWRYCEGGSFHLRNDDGSLMLCNYKKLHDGD